MVLPGEYTERFTLRLPEDLRKEMVASEPVELLSITNLQKRYSELFRVSLIETQEN